MATQESEPGLPIKLHPVGNGEFVPGTPSPVVLEAARRARADAARHARRLGLSRRAFLQSAMGSAVTLAALSACTKEATDAARPGTTPGGSFAVPPDATTDPDTAARALGGEEFVFDVQTHFLDENHDYPPNLGLAFPQGACGAQDVKACFSVDKYLDLLFNKSDTNVIVLSALPFAGSPLDPETMKRTIDLADRLCGDGRTLMQGEAHPSNGPIEGVLDNMAQLRRDLPVAAWKVYTHAGGPGWFLDDHDPDAPQVGARFLEQVRALGPKVVAVHKGFAGIGGDARYASPVDVGPAAVAHPDIAFVVYHSGYDNQQGREGPYDEARDGGVDRLVTSVRRAGLGAGGNVYAELGSTWRSIMTDTTQAAHVLGKLLVAFGPDNVVWGTDSIWYGSPQDQIQAFRAFEISSELQDRYGYPELTPTIKAKILGLNSARLYGIEPITTACHIPRDEIEHARLTGTDTNVTYGPTTPSQAYALARAQAAQFASLG